MTASAIMFIWGIFTTCLLIFGAAPIFSLFIHEPEVIPAGADYLRIIGFSEMFMCVELMTVGALSGMGKTMEASVITTILTTARIPLAVILGGTALGLKWHLVGPDYFKHCKRNYFLWVLSSYYEEDEGIGAAADMLWLDSLAVPDESLINKIPDYKIGKMILNHVENIRNTRE